MKKSYFLLIVIGVILVSAIVLRFAGFGNDKIKTTSSENNLISMSGNDRDTHGCIPSAGYSWCEVKNRCIIITGGERCEEENTNISSSSVSGTEATFTNQALVVSPKQNEVITSPLKIQGNIVGSWFFEGTLPVKLVDADSNVISSGQARADSDWMTEKPVPFSASLDFSTMATSGFLIISKDNPSGLPENDGFIKLPVKFK